MTHETEITLSASTPGVTLGGTLCTPEDLKAAALLLPGSGPCDRDESIGEQRPFKDLASALASRGIATLRCDDRGVGSSGGEYLAIDAERLLADARAQLAFLAEHTPAVPIAVIGHSQGTIFATRLAALDEQVSRLVLLAGAVREGFEMMMDMRGLMADDAALEGEDRAAYLEHSRSLFRALIEHDTHEDRARAVRTLISQSVEGTSDEDFRPDFDGVEDYIEFAVADAMEWEVRALLTSHTAHDLRSVTTPTLAIWGALDRHVASRTEREAFDRIGLPNCESHVLDGLNHLFQSSSDGVIESYPDDGPTMRDPVPDLIARWILSVNHL